jgi:acylphosphatase
VNGYRLVTFKRAVVRCVCFIAGIWYLGQALEVSGWVWRGDSGPVAYGAAGISPAATRQMR